MFFSKKTKPEGFQKPADPLVEADTLIQTGEPGKALAILNRLKAQRTPIRNTDLKRASCFEAMHQPVAALEAAKEELRLFVDNLEASQTVHRLESSLSPETSIGPDDFQAIYRRIRTFTMLGQARLLSLYNLSRQVCEKDIAGAFVECGVAAGGSSALLASIIQRHSKGPRQLFSFDTFTGMPDASPLDKHAEVAADDTGWGAGTCAAPINSLRAICNELNVMDIVTPVQGLFSDTLPKFRGQIGPIAFLHMDGDWYSSTRDILENLFDQVVEGGLIQIDDYGYWEGCARAVKEFEQTRGLHFDLHTIDETGVWMTKTKHNPRSRLLNLGCGGRFHADWINIDLSVDNPLVLKHDLRTRLPFDDGSFSAVYHSHVLEHLSRDEASLFLNECCRIMASGGTLRVVVPDLECIVRLYLQSLEGAIAGSSEAADRHEWMTLELLDQMVRDKPGGEMAKHWQKAFMPAEAFVIQRMGQEVLSYRAGLLQTAPDYQPPLNDLNEGEISRFRNSGEIHKWMYDRWSLRLLLEKTGFRDFTVCSAKESKIPGFDTYLLDVSPEGMTRKPDSIFVEATKP